MGIFTIYMQSYYPATGGAVSEDHPAHFHQRMMKGILSLSESRTCCLTECIAGKHWDRIKSHTFTMEM